MNAEIDVRHVLPADPGADADPSQRERADDPGGVGPPSGPAHPQRASTSSSPASITCPSWATPTRSWTRSRFLTGTRRGVEPDRVLATVLFTDIVDATRKASEVGDRRWRDLLEAHHGAVREELSRFRGREIDTAGDGFLAAFDGPARAVRAASAIRSDVKRLGLEIRAGLHTGECEIVGAKLSGVAVHIGARIASLAGRRRGAGVQHGPRPGGGLRAAIRGPGAAHAQGRSRRLARLRR